MPQPGIARADLEGGPEVGVEGDQRQVAADDDGRRPRRLDRRSQAALLGQGVDPGLLGADLVGHDARVLVRQPVPLDLGRRRSLRLAARAARQLAIDLGGEQGAALGQRVAGVEAGRAVASSSRVAPM